MAAINIQPIVTIRDSSRRALRIRVNGSCLLGGIRKDTMRGLFIRARSELQFF